jgi:hypothetical protein
MRMRSNSAAVTFSLLLLAIVIVDLYTSCDYVYDISPYHGRTLKEVYISTPIHNFRVVLSFASVPHSSHVHASAMLLSIVVS